MAPRAPILRLPLGLVLCIINQVYADLPYGPSYIFSNPKSSNGEYYILQSPSSSSASTGRLLSFNVSSPLTTESLSTTVLSSSLPFLQQDPNLAYTAVARSDGSIAVYVGDCTAQASTSALWIYTPGKIWSQETISVPDTGNVGAQYLSAAATFPSTASADDSIYVFGGMCPNSSSTLSTWMADAEYSNQLLTFQPTSADYIITSQTVQPTPEAGMTMVALQPTFKNQTDGPQIREQNYVLLGGQTSNAFIGVNTVAVLSLPQPSWTFPTVTIAAASTDLATKRQMTLIEPRSGHSAVLSQDGSQIIVFGGWVGDVSTPAQPQLAFLQIGPGFGSSSEWTWTASDSIPFDPGNGVYGHAATMLPGEIMLVIGGYNIANTSSSDQALNCQNLFFNMSSRQWIPSYHWESATNSTSLTSAPSSNPGGLLNSAAKKAGLGAGLALGLVVLICIAIFSITYYRKLERQRNAREAELWSGREKDVDVLAVAAHGLRGSRSRESHGTSDTGDGWHYGGQTKRSTYPWGIDGRPGDNIDIRNSETSGFYVDVSSPQRGLRRSMIGQGNYHSAPRYDEERQAYTSGDMHAIEERDEEISNGSSWRKASVTIQGPSTPKLGLETEILDPFKDPVSLSAISPEEMTTSGSGSVGGWGAHSSSPPKSGRSSPSKSARTESDLSERSVRSEIFAADLLPSGQTSSGSAIRSYLPSILPGGLFNPFASSNSLSGRGERPPTSVVSCGLSERAFSFTTAKTTICQLQAESQTLLGSGQGRKSTSDRPSFSVPRMTETVDLVPDTEPTFPLPKARTTVERVSPRRGSVVGTWVGSIKRVGRAFASGRTVSLTSEAARFYPRPSAIGDDGYYERNIPKKSEPGGLADLSVTDHLETEKHRRERLRRSVSEGAATSLFAAKRGPPDWNAESNRALLPACNVTDYRPMSAGISLRSVAESAWGGSQEEDWDVESAIERRVVQVMYTVPRERLRVVNADVDSISIASGVDEHKFAKGVNTKQKAMIGTVGTLG